MTLKSFFIFVSILNLNTKFRKPLSSHRKLRKQKFILPYLEIHTPYHSMLMEFEIKFKKILTRTFQDKSD